MALPLAEKMFYETPASKLSLCWEAPLRPKWPRQRRWSSAKACAILAEPVLTFPAKSLTYQGRLRQRGAKIEK
jgi:hypothetical protein